MSERYPDCGHPVEYMTHQTPLGPDVFALRCLTCFREWQESGWCCECGSENARLREVESHPPGAADFYACTSCYRRMIVPRQCEVCGRFAGSKGKDLEMGEIEAFYGCDGPEPPEPIYVFVCPRSSCRKGAEEIRAAVLKRAEVTAEIGGAMYAAALMSEADW